MGSAKHPQTEFNFKTDPESVAIFLNSPVKNKTLVSAFDVVEKNKISKVILLQIYQKPGFHKK